MRRDKLSDEDREGQDRGRSKKKESVPKADGRNDEKGEQKVGSDEFKWSVADNGALTEVVLRHKESSHDAPWTSRDRRNLGGGLASLNAQNIKKGDNMLKVDTMIFCKRNKAYSHPG